MESGFNILLIEDNPGDARLIELLLNESGMPGYDLIHAASLSEGLEVLENNDNISLILLDLTLPDSRGFETLERVVEKFP